MNIKKDRSIIKLLRRTALTVTATVGGIGLLAFASLWIAARPVLNAASTELSAIGPVCDRPFSHPSGYPKSLREIQSFENAEWEVYRGICKRHDIKGCFHLSELGFAVYRPAYLNQCQIRALTLRHDSPVGIALNRLYPGRNHEQLNNHELDCVAAVLRAGWTHRAEILGNCTLPKRPPL
ncbi:hypothetical protein [Sphingobium sp. AP50]|uniref:hypothetical protein n=1 Tax=Sphingobium sp. AP50 TaxID=1884369 RepID=UPI00116040EF|nr:hypothetical protein [Sphingobium sp. AP50]